MFFRTDRQGLPIKRSYIGGLAIYEDVKQKKIQGKTISPANFERTEDYTKEAMLRKSTVT